MGRNARKAVTRRDLDQTVFVGERIVLAVERQGVLIRGLGVGIVEERVQPSSVQARSSLHPLPSGRADIFEVGAPYGLACHELNVIVQVRAKDACVPGHVRSGIRLQGPAKPGLIRVRNDLFQIGVADEEVCQRARRIGTRAGQLGWRRSAVGLRISEISRGIRQYLVGEAGARIDPVVGVLPAERRAKFVAQVYLRRVEPCGHGQ